MLTQDLLGKIILELRLKKGLSQQQLADLIFVTRKTVSNWESGRRMPDLATLSRLASALDVGTYELLDKTIDPDDPLYTIIVEDEPAILKGFVRILSDTLPDIQAFGFQNGSDAVAFAKANYVDIAFLDIELFGESGIELAELLSKINPRTNIIFLTSHSEYAMDALGIHCSGFILKPLTPEKIRQEIRHLRFPVRGL